MIKEVVVTIILIAISMFGNMSALRLLRVFRSRALISPSLLTKIGTGVCATLTIVIFFCANDILSIAIALFAVITVMILSLNMIERRQIDTLKNEVPGFLDRWILNMKLGFSLSAARAAALSESDARFTALLQPLFVASSSTRSAHLILDARLKQELVELSISPHSALQRLEFARANMKKSSEFRRKSGQAVRQTTIQSSVLLILLAALAVFTVHRHGWYRSYDLVSASMLLSAVGIITMRKLARKTKWKI